MNIEKASNNEDKIKNIIDFNKLEEFFDNDEDIDDELDFDISEDTSGICDCLMDDEPDDTYKTKEIVIEDRFNLDEITDFLLNMTDGKELIKEFKDIITNKCNIIEPNKELSKYEKRIFEYEKQVLFGFKRYFEKLIFTIEDSEADNAYHDWAMEKYFERERKKDIEELYWGYDCDA